MRFLLFLVFFTSTLMGAPPKVVIFDFGGVVGSVDRKPMLEFLSDSLDHPYRKLRNDLSNDKLYPPLNEPLSYWEKYAKHPLSKTWQTEFEKQKAEIVTLNPEVIALIHRLKQKSIQVALLSNTSPNRARFIEKTGSYSLFDPILLSCYLGAKKPDPEIYTELLKHLNWSADQCLFIDNRQKNVEAAKNMGIDSILFEDASQLEDELRKRGL